MATTQKATPITLTLTDKAAAEVRKFMAEEKATPETAGLRVGVLPGGCSGFRYSLSIEDKPADDDIVIESAGVRCFVDGFSAQYLNGVTLDYRSNFQESGFAFDNPNATGGCGCGSSFTV
ncbi:MAG: iron-sulfur cluster assembly accessory protein [Gemmatimonadetes bacterium]|nr:MAG: iron-sulfur cluster assembly accessory protein [Gemmatimonadota bacterium]